MLKVKAIPLWSDPKRSCSMVSQEINLEIRLEEHTEASMKDVALVETKVGVDFWFMKWRSFVIAKFSMNSPLLHEKGEFHALLLELRSPLMRIGMAEDMVARKRERMFCGIAELFGLVGSCGM